LLIDVSRWRIPKENSEKHLNTWREILDHQKSHPEKYLYSRSRIFKLTEEASSEESWLAIDEYEDRETYDKTMKALESDPGIACPTSIPGSMKTERWTLMLDCQPRPTKSE